MPTYTNPYEVWGRLWSVLRMLLVAAICLASIAAIYLSVAVWIQMENVPDIASLESYDRGDPIQIFDRYDRLVYSVKGTEKRRHVTLAEIAPIAKAAVLAAEDHKFYEHQGIDPVGMARAFFANLRARRVVEGGSTITQQLVKNLFFDEPRRTLERKVAEAAIALEIEQRYSKDQILEFYLNEAYFGNGAYGIEQAARYYFGKPSGFLTLPESAFLAGLIKSPSRLGQPDYRKTALEEEDGVISKMQRFGFISEMDAMQARAQPLLFVEKKEAARSEPITKFPYFISYVVDLVNQRYTPGEMRRHGFRVYTSLDQTAQSIAERTLREGIGNAPEGVTQGALATVSVRDGSVVALVGGVTDYEANQYNCATHRHTAGSAFKPFVYLAALERGVVNPESFVEDTPLTVKEPGAREWKPQNFDRAYMGKLTVREALTYSRNVPAVKLAQETGVPAIIDVAKRAGIWETLPNNLSIALGSAAISPLEMAGAYATIARDGLVIKPWVLRRIENKRGHVLKTFNQPISRAFTPDVVTELSDMLRDVVLKGTGKLAQMSNCYVAGKTGTSDQAKDLWFVGFTPDLATAIWGGNDDNLPIPGTHVTGGTVMAGIWGSYNKALYADPALIKSGLIRPQPKSTRNRGNSAPPPTQRYFPGSDPSTSPPAVRTPRVTPVRPRLTMPARPAKLGQLKPQSARMDNTFAPPPPSENKSYRLQF